MVDPELLAILVCPESHQPVAPAAPRLLSRLNAEIAAGRIVNGSGRPLTEPVAEGLVREDGRRLYPVQGGIPIMLLDEAIDLSPSS